MGYYTRYSLDLMGMAIDEKPETIIREFLEDYDDVSYAIDVNGDSEDATKWYDHEDDLKVFSQNYPKVIFILTGEGEKAGDLWKKYFLNGKCQKVEATITYEGFDQSKLK